MNFTWQGRMYDKVNEIVDAALALEGDTQSAFVEAYCATGEHARANIGYVSGYYPYETRLKICLIFKTTHPFFGTAPMSDADKRKVTEAFIAKGGKL